MNKDLEVYGSIQQKKTFNQLSLSTDDTINGWKG